MVSYRCAAMRMSRTGNLRILLIRADGRRSIVRALAGVSDDDWWRNS
jgi:hypothetical protein